jgi:hypothetical protein
MKRVLLAAVIVLAACRDQRQSETSLSFARVSDSSSMIAVEDSLLNGALVGGPAVITPNRDTLSNFGGGMMQGNGATDYGIDHYTKNGIWYVRIQEMTSRALNGKPVWATRARLRLPPETKRDNVATEGLCSIDGKNDPLVIAVTGAAVDSVSFQATHAWRFDPAQRTLHEIPSANVTCAYASGDD